MKGLGLSAVVASLVIVPAALAKNPENKSDQGIGQLKRALAAVATAAYPQGPKSPDQFNPKVDRDQGDDHANPGAILRVCSKQTPAAQRAAICPVGISPD